MSGDLMTDVWRWALPLSTFVMAFASALFGFLAWRSEGSRRRAEARRARLEATIDDLAELFAAIPHDRSKWSEAFSTDFVEKVCKVDFKIDEENPHGRPLIEAIQAVLPREMKNRDGEYMDRYNKARMVAKAYLDLEWKKYKTETGTSD